MNEFVIRQYQSDDVSELAKALAVAQGEIQHARKDTQNLFFKSSYADLPAVIDAAKGPLSKNGLSFSQVVDADSQGGVVLVSLLMHASGQWLRSYYPVKPQKNDPQGLGSALTYARRYSFCALVGVAAIDEDDDGNAGSGYSNQGRAPVPYVPPEIKSKPSNDSMFASPSAREAFKLGVKDRVDAAKKMADLEKIKSANSQKFEDMRASADPLDVETVAELASYYSAAVTKMRNSEILDAARPKTVSEAIANKE